MVFRRAVKDDEDNTFRNKGLDVESLRIWHHLGRGVDIDEYDDDHKASLKSIQTDAQWLGRDMIENQDEVTVDFIYDHMQNWL